jgi:hypothetical protein
MKSPFVASREFVRGVASRADRVFIISKAKVLLTQGTAHTSVVSVESGRWVDVVNTAWDSTAIAVARLPAPKLVLIGEDGDVNVFLGGGKSAREKISPDPVLIRNARTIAGYVYACGMKRQVYRRVDERRWVDVSAPFPDPSERVGFEAIDGYSAEEIYAVGWGGEIWQFDGKKWTDRNGPTSVVLSAVCCVPDGLVYVAGQQGVMIRGRNDVWEVIAWEEEVSVDLWDLCWFGDKLYVATMTALFTLEGNTLVPVDFGDVITPTCYSLTTAEGVLWSVGRDDVASFDGTTWRRYE